MGMTPPALYRYFDDRDELLTALITDAYDSLGAAVAEAVRPLDEADLSARWFAASQAYRAWASAEPQRFALILGMPVPGYGAERRARRPRRPRRRCRSCPACSSRPRCGASCVRR